MIIQRSKLLYVAQMELKNKSAWEEVRQNLIYIYIDIVTIAYCCFSVISEI